MKRIVGQLQRVVGQVRHADGEGIPESGPITAAVTVVVGVPGGQAEIERESVRIRRRQRDRGSVEPTLTPYGDYKQRFQYHRCYYCGNHGRRTEWPANSESQIQ